MCNCSVELSYATMLISTSVHSCQNLILHPQVRSASYYTISSNQSSYSKRCNTRKNELSSTSTFPTTYYSMAPLGTLSPANRSTASSLASWRPSNSSNVMLWPLSLVTADFQLLTKRIPAHDNNAFSTHGMGRYNLLQLHCCWADQNRQEHLR